jgi:uncharacterized damage-inducible protein DinB
MEARLSKSEILRLLNIENSRLQATLARLTPEQMLEPNIVGVWSVKDVIAHMIHWNLLPLRELAFALNGASPDTTDAEHDTDTVNARTVAAYADRPLDEVRADFEACLFRLS